ncbi:glycosyltransferase family 4 protein [Autumnicola musiva]|uniref:Glycosyltransferase family 4 protein n=1 Tax=Autumnicola musiva TaxID=3075589 RepID=A0ABU3D8A9_9FLAO|nr:glycosyltransferase family 4 protein [Zunongwangia sp. F117]MDT0677691.1 glycosyltransferase family 4 protein [Zunongwangia sp. F117]
MKTKDTVKLKVLMLMHLPPPVHGAAMAGNYIQSSDYIQNEIDATIINLGTNTKLQESGKGSIKKISTFLSLLKDLVKAMNQNSFDLCYVSLTASGPGFYKDCVIISILKFYKVKILYHFHTKGVASASSSAINRGLYRYIFKNTQSILLSPYLFFDIEQYVNQDQIHYCPYGIPPISNHVLPVANASKSSKPCQLLYLSNMMEEKGVYILLEALNELKQMGLEFECHFVGGWSDITATDFKDYVKKLNLSEYVTAHGPKYGNDKHWHFNQADIFVFPTYYHYETFGIVNLEAMQYALPIVSTPEAAIPEIVIDGKTGFLVPQKNAALLAEKLEVLIQNTQLRIKMGMAGKERYQMRFTLEKFEHKIVEILKAASA